MQDKSRKIGFIKKDKLPLVALILLAIVWVVIISLYISAKLASLRYLIIDTGSAEQVLWNTLQGDFFQSSIHRGSFFNVHFSPSLFLLVPFYAVGQSTEWLFLLQSLAIVAGTLLIYRLVTVSGFTGWHGFLLGAVWLLCAPTIGIATFDFHEVSICGWLFMLITLFAIRDKLLPVLILMVVLLGIKEDMAIYVASLGLILVLGYGKSRIGWLMVIISVCYFIVIYFWLWNALFPYHWHHEESRFAQFGTQSNVLGALMSNPLLLLEPLLKWDRLWAVGMLLLPLSLLPLWHRASLGLIPSLWLFLSMSFFNWGIFNMHYHAPLLALLFIVTIPSLIWLRNKLPRLFKISIAALIPFTIGMHFAIPPEYAWGIYNPASVKAHPSVYTVRRLFADSPTQSIATDVFAGASEVHRPKLYIYPGSYLADIACSSSAFSSPFAMILIKSMHYGLERPDPVMLMLSRTSQNNATDYYMQRLCWIEAEESNALSWDMRSLPKASGGRALYIAKDYGWGDRSLGLREEILPAGNYRMGVRLACGRKGAGGNVTFSIVTKGEHEESQELAVLDIGKDKLEKDKLKTFWIDFTLEDGSVMRPVLQFGHEGEYWVDGIELQGLVPDFDAYFNSICKASFKASDAILKPSPAEELNPLNSEGMLWLRGEKDEILTMDWQIPSSLNPGAYFLYSHMRVESSEKSQIHWADLYAVKNGERQKIAPLFCENLQINNKDDRILRSKVTIPECDQIEMEIFKSKNNSLMFDQLIFSIMP